MSVNYNEINIPINADKRDPFYGRSKSEIGLGLVPNMSYENLQTAILANVKNTVDAGITYKYQSYASDAIPILADLVKLKPNSSRVKLSISLGTWTDKSEFISRDTATLELRANRTNVSYNLWVTEPYLNNTSESTDEKLNRSTPFTSAKVIIKEFKTGGWLVSIKVVDRLIDAIWVNMTDTKNIDVMNPMSNEYPNSEFGRSIEFYCDKSRISTNLEIGGSNLVAKQLDHDIPIKLDSVDPKDYYNTQSNTHTLTNVDLSGLLGTPSLIKDNTLISIPISTDAKACKGDQLIPMSVNRLNHQIKFRLTGSVHNEQESSWKDAQKDQTNMSAYLDTAPEAINEYPVSITELSHDINMTLGKAAYNGSIPESGKIGEGYEMTDDGKVNYASLINSTTGRNDYYVYDKTSKSWTMSSSEFDKKSNAVSLSTRPNATSELNLVLHGLDHDVKIEAVNSAYRSMRGAATDINEAWRDKRKISTGIRNLTWEEYTDVESEVRRNSYVTGHMKLNTFEKERYQCFDLTVHGLDHNIKLDFYRVSTNVLQGPVKDEVTKSDKYRQRTNGQDIKGTIEIDTFTRRLQSNQLEVIDSRYSDCSRGLAMKLGDNFMPYDNIDSDGNFGSYLPNTPSSDDIEAIYPTINGIPFTGDFRYKVKYPANMERDGVSKEHSVRNIIIPAFHVGESLADAGAHDWEVLSNYRISKYNENGTPISFLLNESYFNRQSEVEHGYGLTRLTTITQYNSGTYNERLSNSLKSLGADSDAVSVKAIKILMDESTKSSAQLYATKVEIEGKINQLTSSLDWRASVATFNDIAKTYPNPDDGWTVNVQDTDITYRYDGAEWIAISANSIPLATNSVPGKMSAEDKEKLDSIESNANNYTLPKATDSILGGVTVGSNITLSDGKISLTQANVTAALGYAPPTTNTTYTEVTSGSSGLMSSADKIKLDSIDEGANNYILPEATNTKLGGIIVGDNIDLSAGTISLSKSNIVNALGYEPPVSDTTYSTATSTTNGLMSSTDKSKLDNIAENANNYVLPNASASLLGGVKIGSNLSINEGTISLNKANVTSALGYVPPMQDTTYNVATDTSNGLMSSEDRKKLDSIEAGLQHYILPEATVSTLGGVIVGDNISVDSNGIISISKDDITSALGYIPSSTDKDTTYVPATPTTDGLMSAADKEKLDGIEAGVGSYVLPTASSDKLGGVKIGNNITITDGAISISKSDVVNALGYEPVSEDLNTEYGVATQDKSGLMSAADKKKLDNDIYTKTELEAKIATVDESTLNSNIDPSVKMTQLMNSLSNASDDDFISVKVLKAIVKAVNERFEKLEESIKI